MYSGLIFSVKLEYLVFLLILQSKCKFCHLSIFEKCNTPECLCRSPNLILKPPSSPQPYPLPPPHCNATREKNAHPFHCNIFAQLNYISTKKTAKVLTFALLTQFYYTYSSFHLAALSSRLKAMKRQSVCNKC